MLCCEAAQCNFSSCNLLKYSMLDISLFFTRSQLIMKGRETVMYRPQRAKQCIRERLTIVVLRDIIYMNCEFEL